MAAPQGLKLKGTNGNDTLNGSAYDDDITSLNGNDTIDAGKGNDKITAGDGNNKIFGGDGSDTIKAGKGNNSIDAGAGNDKITTGDGNNTIFGGDGNDTVKTGKGADVILAGAGNDAVKSGDGNDTVYGGDGNDSIDTGKGNDFADGGAGNDIIAGGAGNDRLFGGTGDDLLLGDGSIGSGGGSGGQALWGSGAGSGGGSGGDKITFNDYLDGGAGNDKLYAGKGNDVANYSMSENIGAIDLYDGGKGSDTLRLELTYGEAANAGVQADLTAYQAFLAANSNPNREHGPSFQFNTANLKASNFEKLDVVLVNQGPTANADANGADAVVESGVNPGNTPNVGDASATGNVLSNDTDPDHLDVLTVAGVAAGPSGGALSTGVGATILGTYGTVTIAGNGSYTYTLNNADTDTNALAQGETASDVFSYTVRDLAGATSSSTLTINITGTNDGPVVAVADVTGAVTEQISPVGNLTDSGTIAFTDVDLTDAHSINPIIVASAGALGALTASVSTDTTGSGLGGVVTWNYSVADMAVEYLAKDQTKVESFTITLDDGNGGTVDRTIEVTITGTNDGPVAVADSNAGDAVVESGVNPGNSSFAGDPSAAGNVLTNDTDIDTGDSKTVSAVNGVAGNVGASIAGTYGSVVIGSDGSYTYTLNNADAETNALAQGASASDVFNYTVKDQFGATSISTLTIAIAGTNDGPVAVADSNGGSAVEPSVTFEAPQGVEAPPYGGPDQPIQAFVDSANLASVANGAQEAVVSSVLAPYQTFHDAAGINDGIYGNPSSWIPNGSGGGWLKIDLGSVFTINEATFGRDRISHYDDRAPGQYKISVATSENNYANGDDSNDTTEYVQVFDSTSVGFSGIVNLNETIRSTFSPTAARYVKMEFSGTGVAIDEVQIYQAGDAVVESGVNPGNTPNAGDPSATGNVLSNDTDPDHLDVLTVAGVAAGPAGGPLAANVGATISGTYGSLTLNSTGGYTYTLDDTDTDTNALAQGASASDVFSYTVKDLAGATSTATLTITITGSNDSPVVTSSTTDASGTVIEAGDLDDGTDVAGTPAASGTLTSSDVDADATATWSIAGASAYGVMAITAAGVWSYTLNNGLAATQGLKEGQSVSESFTATVTDDFGATATQVVTVTVTGSNDGPVAVDDTFAPTALGGPTTVLTFEGMKGSPSFTYQGFEFSGNTTGGSSYFNIFDAGVGTGESGAAYTYGNGYSQTGGVIRRADGADFGVVSVDAASTYNSPVSFFGYNDGEQVASLSIAVDAFYYSYVYGGPYGGPNGHIEFGAAFSDIDRLVVIPGHNDYTYLDNLSIGSIASENFAVDIDVLANDTDVDNGAVLSVAAVAATSALGATVSINPDGTLRYDSTGAGAGAIDALAKGETASDTFSYTVTDEWGATDTATVTVALVGVNDAATIAGTATGSVAEDGTLTTGNTLTVSDVDTGENHFQTPASLAGAYGTFSFDATTGVWGYALNNGAANVQALGASAVAHDTLVVKSFDNTASRTIDVTIAGTNDGPVAVDDSFARAFVPATVLTFEGMDGSPSFTYQGFEFSGNGGYDFFEISYEGTNGSGAASTYDDGYYYTGGVIQRADGADFGVISVDAASRYHDGSPVSFVGYNNGVQVASLSTAVDPSYYSYFFGSPYGGPNGHIEFGAAFSDIDRLVVIPTNDFTYLDNLSIGSIASENFAADIDVLANDTDVDNGAVLSVAGFDATSALGAAVSVNPDGTLRYNSTGAGAIDALAEGETANDTFSYTVTDEWGATETATVTVALVGQNDGPVAVDDSYAPPAIVPAAVLTFEGMESYGSFTYQGFEFSGNGGPGFFEIYYEYYGTGESGAAYTYSDGYYTGGVIQRADGADFGVISVDAASFSYGGSPVSFVGYNNGVQVASLSTAVDPYWNGGQYGGPNGHIEFAAAFSDIDRLAVIPAYDYTVIDNLSIGYIASENFVADIDVLANDIDVDNGAVLSVAAVAATSALGATVSINPDGTLRYDSTGAGAIAVNALAKGQTANDTFSYTVTDEWGATDTATVTVALVGQNDGPVAAADSGATTENAPITIDVLANDTDVDTGHVFTLLGVSAAAGSASVFANQLVFNPGTAFDYLAAGVQTTVNVNYTMRDEHNAQSSSVATITVTGENDGPVAKNDAVYSFSPGAGFLLNPANGHYYAATAGASMWTNMSNTATAMGGYLATITSAAENAFIFANLNPGGANMWLGGSDAAVEGEWRWTVGPEAGTQFWQGGTGGATVGGNYTNWQPGSEPNNYGNEDHVLMQGGGYWNDLNFNYTQRGIVEIGGRAGDPDQVPLTNEDTSYAINTATLLANDTDVDVGDVLTVTGVAATSANGASVSLAGGVITYGPSGSATLNALAAGQSIVDTFTYTIGDGQGGSSSATVSLRVAGTNDAPTAVADTASTNEDTSILINVLGNDTDVDNGHVLSIGGFNGTSNLSGTSAHGAALSVSNGQIIYDPTHAASLQAMENWQSDLDTFTYAVKDEFGATSSTTVSVNVAGVHDVAEHLVTFDGGAGTVRTSVTGPVYSLVFGGGDSESGYIFDWVYDHDANFVTSYQENGMIFSAIPGTQAEGGMGYAGPGNTAVDHLSLNPDVHGNSMYVGPNGFGYEASSAAVHIQRADGGTFSLDSMWIAGPGWRGDVAIDSSNGVYGSVNAFPAGTGLAVDPNGGGVLVSNLPIHDVSWIDLTFSGGDRFDNMHFLF